MSSRLSFDRRRIVEVCRRHHIRRLELFGSVLRDDFGPSSDVDVLVEFEPDHIPGFLALDRIANELSEVFSGRRVDLVTRAALLDSLRDGILESAELVHAEG